MAGPGSAARVRDSSAESVALLGGAAAREAVTSTAAPPTEPGDRLRALVRAVRTGARSTPTSTTDPGGSAGVGRTDEAASDAIELHRAFLAATLWCERPARPGFVAWRTPDPAPDRTGSPESTGSTESTATAARRGLIAVFSSERQLAAACGPVAWFALPGAALLDALPEGFDLLLDPAGAAPLLLRTAALRRVIELDITDAGAGALR